MRRLVILVPFLFMIVGCGSFTSLAANQAPAGQDACHLLTVAEIQQYWGWPNTEPQAEQGQNGPSCDWHDTSGTDETVMRLEFGPADVERCDEARALPGSQAISGIGDWAYWSADRNKMYVKQGADCLVVLPNSPRDASIDFLASLTALAKLAAGRL